MSFLDRFPVPEREQQEIEEHERTPFFEPPRDELGVVVPLNALLGRSETAVVALSHAVAYSDGVALNFIAIVRGMKPSNVHEFLQAQHMWGGEDLSDAFLRLGVEFSDGRRVSNIGGHRHDLGDDPEGPILWPQAGGGGGGSGTRIEIRPACWMWPLPPPGALALSCEWPAAGILFTTVEVDADTIRAASEQATALWNT